MGSKKDPRDRVTEQAFRVDPALLETPLASPWRRLTALTLDAILGKLLETLLGVLVFVGLGWVCFRAAQNVPKIGLASRMRRSSLLALSLLLFLVGSLQIFDDESEEAKQKEVVSTRTPVRPKPSVDGGIQSEQIEALIRAAHELGSPEELGPAVNRILDNQDFTRPGPASVRAQRSQLLMSSYMVYYFGLGSLGVVLLLIAWRGPWTSERLRRGRIPIFLLGGLLLVVGFALGIRSSMISQVAPTLNNLKHTQLSQLLKVLETERSLEDNKFIIERLLEDLIEKEEGTLYQKGVLGAALVTHAVTIQEEQEEHQARSEDEHDSRRRHLKHQLEQCRNKAEAWDTQKYVASVLETLGLTVGWLGLYFTIFTRYMGGQTLGKRLMGIRVVRLDGQPLTLWGALERCGGYTAGVATGLLGFAQIYWDNNRQAIHDKICGTVVIRSKRKVEHTNNGLPNDAEALEQNSNGRSK